MTDTATGTAAPLELKLAGKTYRMRPIGFAEIGEFEQWVRQTHIARAESLIGHFDDATKQQIRMDAVRMAQKISMNATDPEAVRVMDEMSSSVEGITRLVHLSIRREHPDATLEQIAGAMEDQATAMMAMRQFNTLNREGEGADGAKKKQAKRKPRKKKSR